MDDPTLPDTVLRNISVPRITMAITALVIYLVTIHMIRKERLREAYSIMWLLAATVILVVALLGDLPKWLQKMTAVPFATISVGMTLVLLLVIVFHFALVVSRLDKENKRLAQKMAVMNNRLEELERQGDETDEGKGD